MGKPNLPIMTCFSLMSCMPAKTNFTQLQTYDLGHRTIKQTAVPSLCAQPSDKPTDAHIYHQQPSIMLITHVQPQTTLTLCSVPSHRQTTTQVHPPPWAHKQVAYKHMVYRLITYSTQGLIWVGELELWLGFEIAQNKG